MTATIRASSRALHITMTASVVLILLLCEGVSSAYSQSAAANKKKNPRKKKRSPPHPLPSSPPLSPSPSPSAQFPQGNGTTGASDNTCWNGFAKGGTFEHCQVLSSVMVVYWKVTKEDPNILIGIDVVQPNLNGWAAFGISEAGGMKGADMFVLGKTALLNRSLPPGVAPAKAPMGDFMVMDVNSVEFAVPQADENQTVELLAMDTQSKPGRWLATVRRPVSSCDPEDISIKETVPNFVIWALGSVWPRGHSSTDRGNDVIDFFGNTTLSFTEDVKTLDLAMPNVTVPADLTTYMCINFKVPEDAKYHIVRSEAIIASPKLLHHMILFACLDRPSLLDEAYLCGDMMGTCITFNVGWAPGQNAMELPPEAGLPFGKSSTTYFALQAHYNNPDGIEGVVDASGFRLSFTSVLRPKDLWVLTLGQLSLNLPPGQEAVQAYPSVCPSACTSRLTKPLKMVLVGLHMHMAGTTAMTRLFRNGTDMGPLDQRLHWDFNFQGARHVPPENSVLLPGDTLVTTCIYNTMDRTETTRQGESTLNEMCYAFVGVYEMDTEVGATLPEGVTPFNNTVAEARMEICISVKVPSQFAKLGQGAGIVSPGAESYVQVCGSQKSLSKIQTLPDVLKLYATGGLAKWQAPPAGYNNTWMDAKCKVP